MSAFHCTRDGIAKHITCCVQRPDTKPGGRVCKDEDRKLCKSRFCLKAGYEMAHNFTFPEDPKPGAVSSSSYGYIASLFSCCADLPSWPKPLETGLRPYCCHRDFIIKVGAERTERTGCTFPALSFIVNC